MDKTIKTQVLEAIQEALATITEVKTIARIPATGIDLDVAPTPALFFYDESETRDKRNRLAVGTMKIIIFAYIALQMSDYDSAGEMADFLQGKVHTVMTQEILTGQPLIQMMVEGPVLKDYPNDEYMVLIMEYNVTYQHTWGNAFSVANF